MKVLKGGVAILLGCLPSLVYAQVERGDDHRIDFKKLEELARNDYRATAESNFSLTLSKPDGRTPAWMLVSEADSKLPARKLRELQTETLIKGNRDRSKEHRGQGDLPDQAPIKILVQQQTNGSGSIEPAWAANGDKGVARCNQSLNNLRTGGRFKSFSPTVTNKAVKLELDFAQYCLDLPTGEIDERVGRVVVDGEVKCTAFLISPSRALTSRHCVFERVAKKQATIFKPTIGVNTSLTYENGALKGPKSFKVRGIFLPIRDASTPVYYEITKLPMFEDKLELDNDIMVLVLAESAAREDLRVIDWGIPRFGDKIILPAFAAGAELEGKGQEKGIRIQTSGYCQVFTNPSPRCFRHGCAVSPGASGAPVILERLERGKTVLLLAGVHTGGSGKDASCPGSADLELSLNFGSSITEVEYKSMAE